MKEPKIVSHRSDEDYDTRWQTIKGKDLTYDDGIITYDSHDDWDTEEPDDPRWEQRGTDEYKEEWSKRGRSAELAERYGIPFKVSAPRPNRLACTCHVAFLHGIGEVVDGQIEVDYVCDSGWHNYYVYQVQEKKVATKTKKKIMIDTTGKVTNKEGFKATELETF